MQIMISVALGKIHTRRKNMLLTVDDDFVDRLLIKELKNCYSHLEEDDPLREAIKEVLAHYMVPNDYFLFINT